MHKFKLVSKYQPTGASSDLKNTSVLAREMVTEEGMGSALRNQVFNASEVNYFGDRAKSYSEKTAELIDQEIEKLTKEATARAEAVLKTNKSALDALASPLRQTPLIFIRQRPRKHTHDLDIYEQVCYNRRIG